MGRKKLDIGEKKVSYSFTIKLKDVMRLEEMAKRFGVQPIALTRFIVLDALNMEYMQPHFLTNEEREQNFIMKKLEEMDSPDFMETLDKEKARWNK